MITIRPNQIAATMLLASLATSAYFFAQGTTSLIAAKLFGLDEADANAAGRPGGGRRSAAPAPTVPRRTVSAATILERNIFEPPSLLPDAGVAADPAGAPPVVIDLDTQNAPACPADHRMLGAVVNPALPSWSYAALSQGQSPAILHRVGQTFASKTVYRIDSGYDPDEPLLPGGQRRPRSRVVLQDAGGQFCQITMFAPAGGAAPPAATAAATAPAASAQAPTAAPVPPPGQAGGELTASELEQGIVRVSDTQFTVDRALMERALAQQDSLFRSARLIPSDDGDASGMKIYGIRRSSVLGRLGLQNGDVLGNVNGQSMGSADALVQAYQNLGRAGTFSVSVTRRGQPMTINYQVQ